MRLTKAGALYIASTLTLGFAAVNTGNNLLYMLVSLLLAYMATSGVIGRLNIHLLQCQVSFPDEIYSGKPTLVSVELQNMKKRLPSYILNARLLGKSCKFNIVDAGAFQIASFTHTFEGRGKHPGGSAVISSPFPVNFFVRGIELRIDEGPIVFPAPKTVTDEAFSSNSDSSGEYKHLGRGYEGDLTTIRDYSGSEPLKSIHWRLSARHDSLKVKELEATCSEPVIIDLTVSTSLLLEEKLSQAAFMINRLIRLNRAVGLKISANSSIPPSTGHYHRIRMLKELALYDSTCPSP